MVEHKGCSNGTCVYGCPACEQEERGRGTRADRYQLVHITGEGQIFEAVEQVGLDEALDEARRLITDEIATHVTIAKVSTSEQKPLRHNNSDTDKNGR
jgi:hypothetical protein